MRGKTLNLINVAFLTDVFLAAYISFLMDTNSNTSVKRPITLLHGSRCKIEIVFRGTHSCFLFIILATMARNAKEYDYAK